MQIFLEELTLRLPHLTLSEQTFTYVPNTSFRGPEHVWVHWDPAANPERHNPAILTRQHPIRLGEPSTHSLSRQVMVQETEMLTDDIMRIRLVATDGQTLPRWTPGSHIDLVCGDQGISRQYSLCGDPANPQVLDIAVLREDAGRGGSAWVHQHVRSGLALYIRGPRNHFHFDEKTKRAILIAGGIGITPISAMARAARARGMDYQIHYCGRSRKNMALLASLQEHGDRLHVYAADEGKRADFPNLLATPNPDTQIYACGPQRLTDALQKICESWPDDALHIEHFHSTLGKLDPTREHAFEAELKQSGFTVTVAADQTLLAALRAANIDIQSDCEEGLCGSCEVGVLAGQPDHRDVVLTRSERASGNKMMSCCSRAKDKRIVLDL